MKDREILVGDPDTSVPVPEGFFAFNISAVVTSGGWTSRSRVVILVPLADIKAVIYEATEFGAQHRYWFDDQGNTKI